MDVQSNWWETFFQGVAVDMWLEAVSPEHSRHEAASIEQLLGRSQGRRFSTVRAAGGVLRSSSPQRAIA